MSAKNEEQWISVSDLMAGLMMIFLFISIALMRSAFIERDQAEIEKNRIQQIALTYRQRQDALFQALYEEFKNDLPHWQAHLDQTTLSLEFLSPDVLFDQGSYHLKPRFQSILADFFPRYLKIIDRFKEYIEEIRIEGHTSSIWNKKTDADAAYFYNMALSQGRTRSVLKYIYHLDNISSHREWIKKHIAAVGYSSAHIKLDQQGKEDRQTSRRVAFRVITNAEKQIRKILNEH